MTRRHFRIAVERGHHPSSHARQRFARTGHCDEPALNLHFLLNQLAKRRMMMDRRTLLQVGVPAAVAASIAVSSSADAAVRAGAGAKPIRILFLDHAPRKQSGDRLYDPTPIERLLNSYANPGTQIEIGYPDNYDGSKVGLLLGEQDKLNGLDHLMAAPALIRKIFWAQENG